MKVLIVDDNSQMRGMMRQFLPSTAGEICECEDGIDALECSHSGVSARAGNLRRVANADLFLRRRYESDA